MDQQEKDALEFFEEFMVKEQAEEALDMSHITKREGRITCNISPSNLLCLVEPRVDLDNLSQNGFNLNEEIHLQSWEKFFTMLNGPTYGALVKEFWKMAECDRHHIVSHDSGKRVIITEKTIGDLLGLDHREGIRIGGRNEKDEFISNVIDTEIFIDLDPTKPTSEYKSISLVPKLRIWYQILINCINPKPLNLISENLNADQKYFLYHLKNKDMSWFSYDMLPDTMEEIYGGKKKKKKSAERDMANKRKPRSEEHTSELQSH